jgi:tetratricopeptide (TPR) repeat protein
MAHEGDRPQTATAAGLAGRRYAPRVFVSATSRDLGSHRQVVCSELLKGECLPVVQERFPSDPRKLSDFLTDEVRKCDAVVCLMGPRFGEAPAAGGALRSYTQMEYDTARQLNKDVYVFVAAPGCPLDSAEPETEAKRCLQQEHLASVQRRDQSICKLFAGPEELRAHVIRLLPVLVRSRQPRYWVQSAQSYSFFAGRAAELEQLTLAATGDGPCAIVVLGVAGQGKTTLVWEWFSQHCPDVFAGAFWCPAEANQYTFDMFVDLALAYLMQGKYEKRSFPAVQTRVRMLLQQLEDRPCLLVIDGLEKWLRAWAQHGAGPRSAEEADGRLGGHDGLDLFLGQLFAVSGGSRVVLTSRVLPTVLAAAPHAVIPVLDEVAQARLRGLDDAAAVALLRRLGVRAGDGELLAAVRGFENHPLSLTILGKLAARKYGGSIEHFRGGQRTIAEDDRLRVLLQEMEQALPSREDSAHLLDLLSHFIETPSYGAFAGFLGWVALTEAHAALASRPVLHLDDDALREGLAVLDDWSLITWDRASDALHLHPLLREHFRCASRRAEAIHAALAAWYLSRDVPGNACALQDMRPRILAVEHGLLAGRADLCDTAILAPVAGCASLPEWLALWGHQATGTDLLSKVIPGTREPAHSKHLVSRGAMLAHLDRLTEARADLDAAVCWLGSSLRQRLRHREALAGACMNRGIVLADAGEIQPALGSFGDALAAVRRPFGRGAWADAMAADILANRAGVNREGGHLSAAERDATEALALYRRCASSTACPLPGRHRRIAMALLNRGNALANGRRYDAADADYVAGLREMEGPDACAEGRAEGLRALLHIGRGLLLSDRGDAASAIRELSVAIDALGELMRNGSSDVRTTLALALSNRAESLIMTGGLERAVEDVQAAERLYRESSWEESSTLAMWLAANHTTQEGLSRILRTKIDICGPRASMLDAWRDMNRRHGSHVLAPFVRANGGIARLAFPHDPRFSAQTVTGVLAIVQEGMAGGYWSEWLVWEVHDLRAFVAAERAPLAELGVQADNVDALYHELRRRAKQKGHGIHVPT